MIRRHGAELRALLVLGDALLAVAVFAVLSSVRVGAASTSDWFDAIRLAGRR